jgi:hypothetical protein
MVALRPQLFLRVRALDPAPVGRRLLGQPIPQIVQTKPRRRGPVLILLAGTNAPRIVHPLSLLVRTRFPDPQEGARRVLVGTRVWEPREARVASSLARCEFYERKQREGMVQLAR